MGLGRKVVIILIFDKIGFKWKLIKSDKEGIFF